MIPDYSHDIQRIRLAQLNFFLRPDIALSLSYWLSQFRKAKVWYHQIWIQKYLGFIVSDLVFIPTHALMNES